MRIRAAVAGDRVEVRVMMAHAMETGLRKDANGKPIPAHFIRTVAVVHGKRTVFSAQWGPMVSRNPFLHLRFKGGKPGEKISITWTDNLGGTRTDEAVIAGT